LEDAAVALTEAQRQRPVAVPGLVTVLARGRSAPEVVEDLMGSLSGEPRVVECDLTGMTAEGTATGEVFAPVGHYLHHWPGTMVLMRAPDPVVRSSLTSMTYADRMIIHTGWDNGALEAHRLLPRVHRKTLSLAPAPTAPRLAHDFAAGTLQEWAPALMTPASQVLSEFVTHAVISSDSDVAVSLSRVDTRVRIAVTNPAAKLPVAPVDLPEHPLTGRAQQLVLALARGWGVIQGRLVGTTMWAVLDALPGLAGDDRLGTGLERAEPLHRGPADPDVLTELQGPPSGRHRRQTDAAEARTNS
jgi:hypothetical protein